MRTRTALASAVVAVVLSACGGDGGNDAGTAGPSSTSPTPATTVVTPSSTSTTAASASTSSSTPSGTGLSASSVLDLRSLGPVRVGMTLAEATAAAGVPVEGPGTPVECSYATATGGPSGVRFMVVDSRIARIEVDRDSQVKTRSGAGIGDTEEQVQARYADGLEVSPHKYVVGGHYLTLVPVDAADRDFRLIFETDGSKVTAMRSGKVPEVELVEGCS